MALLSHWSLRDEIKASYADHTKGLEKQVMIYPVMKRIISQEIPEQVINNKEYEWTPCINEVFQKGEKVVYSPEPCRRYQHILNNFKALKAIDPFSPDLDSYIKRKFSGEMEIT